MKEIDNENVTENEGFEEEDLLLNHVIQEDHELLYLDTYLGELFKKTVG